MPMITNPSSSLRRNIRNRIFRKKEYSLLEQVPISVADFNALAVRNYEGTEQIQIYLESGQDDSGFIK